MSLTNCLAQHLHPAFFLGGTVSVEVDHLAVGEADTEALFDKHVALFFFSES